MEWARLEVVLIESRIHPPLMPTETRIGGIQIHLAAVQMEQYDFSFLGNKASYTLNNFEKSRPRLQFKLHKHMDPIFLKLSCLKTKPENAWQHF